MSVMKHFFNYFRKCVHKIVDLFKKREYKRCMMNTKVALFWYDWSAYACADACFVPVQRRYNVLMK